MCTLECFGVVGLVAASSAFWVPLVMKVLPPRRLLASRLRDTCAHEHPHPPTDPVIPHSQSPFPPRDPYAARQQTGVIGEGTVSSQNPLFRFISST